ncbi:MAG TPA: O-antigen ligase family protein, partial [Bacteroidia bacterium]|nr:O-antigen ligase family protein [Bacteroidia bacterium]
MVRKKEIVIFYILSILFVCLDLLFIVLRINFLAALLPLVALIVYLALFSLDKLMLFVVFCTPLSINIFQVPGLGLGEIGVGMALPTEPIMFGIMLLFFMHIAYSGYDKSAFRHPVSIVIALSLLWMFVTCFTSTMYFVSFKFLLERSWGVFTFFFLGILLFKKTKNIYSFNWLYVSAFTIVIIYTFIRHYPSHFSEKGAHTAVNPFYNDHTAYGAMLAMFVPVLGGLSLIKKNKPIIRIIAFALFLLFLLALAFSYSRAAWLSTVAAIVLFVLMLFRVKLKWILAGFVVGLCLFFAYQTSIIMKLQRNNTDVSQDIGKEIQSISNISSDASNRERLNRWSCAYRMWLDKPVFGYGPGTYMFKYAPYQLSYMRTIISTNEGNGGNAHNEYLGPLAEQGAFGMIIMLALATTVITLAFRLFYTLKDRDMRILVMSIFLGLITYFVHGLMNNFLDTDKAAVPFWGFIAMLVA